MGIEELFKEKKKSRAGFLASFVLLSVIIPTSISSNSFSSQKIVPMQKSEYFSSVSSSKPRKQICEVVKQPNLTKRLGGKRSLFNFREPNVASHPNLTKRLNYDRFSSDSDKVLLARMLFGEGRNLCDKELYIIAHTVLNRVKKRKTNLRTEVLRPWQYSCFNKNDPNLVKLSNPLNHSPNKWKKCLQIAEDVLEGSNKIYNLGQTHYHRKDINPYWSKFMKKKIVSLDLAHQFYKGN